MAKVQRRYSEAKASGKIWFALTRMTKRIWFRSAIYAVIAILTAFVAYLGKFFIPENLVTKIGSDAVGNILSILAASMLTVATFSLSIMVTAFGNVSSGATPRASRLLIEDQKSQSAVATFIGAFLYSIVGLVTLSAGIYGVSGRFILFVVTIAVILWMIATLIRWVDQLATLGRVGDTIEKIEVATIEALKERAMRPTLGAHSYEAWNFDKHPVLPIDVGYVSFIDVPALHRACEKLKTKLRLEVSPGSFLYPMRPLAMSSRPLNEKEAIEICHHFIVESSRSFQQDPRFGLLTLAEVGTRALSSAINDPGTVIEVMGAGVRLLTKWSRLSNECLSSASEILAANLYVQIR